MLALGIQQIQPFTDKLQEQIYVLISTETETDLLNPG